MNAPSRLRFVVIATKTVDHPLTPRQERACEILKTHGMGDLINNTEFIVRRFVGEDARAKAEAGCPGAQYDSVWEAVEE